MKTVSGEVISSKSISLKKGAKTLSNFASSENGASPAFSVYLKQAVNSFNELVQLHKESKSLESEHKVKKRGSMDISGDGIVGFVMNSGYEGFVRERDSSERKDSRRVNKIEGIVDGNGVDGKKVKKEREDSKTDITENKAYHELDVINLNRLKNETESLDGSTDIKKKKKKRDKIKREIEMEVESLPHNENFNDVQAIKIGEKHSNKQRKHKNEQPSSDHPPMNAIEVKNEIESFDGSIEMKKKTRNSSGINGDKQSSEIHGNVENVDKSKRIHEGKRRKNEGKLEIEATNKKESRKRKHERVIAEGLDSSQERHKSKKKR